MSRSRERFAALILALAVMAAPASAWADRAAPTPVPEDAVMPVEDLITPVDDVIAEVESLDGTESEEKQGEQITLALTADVLFPLDKATLTAKARQRLREIAEKIKSDGAGGLIRVEGHTDDQGSDAYNLALSRRRAEAVRRVLERELAGMNVTLQAKGYGESRPKVPNFIKGRPVEKNRAKNRRVEIIFTARR